MQRAGVRRGYGGGGRDLSFTERSPSIQLHRKYRIFYGITNQLFLSMDMCDTYTGITWYHGLVYGLHVSCSAVPYAVWCPHLSNRWSANQ